MKDPKRVKAGKKSRNKGGVGMREIKALLESLDNEVVICHGTGMEDISGGDLWVNKSQFAQVKYQSTIPKKLYDALEKCPVAFVRRVNAKDRKKYPWLKISLVEPNVDETKGLK